MSVHYYPLWLEMGGGLLMRKLILNDEEECVGCNRCIRVCPTERALTGFKE